MVSLSACASFEPGAAERRCKLCNEIFGLRPVTKAGSRVQVPNRTNIRRCGRPRPAPSSRTRSSRPSGSFSLAATMLGNGSGSRGTGSQPFARQGFQRRIALRHRRLEVRRRGQKRADDLAVRAFRPVRRHDAAGAMGDDDQRAADPLRRRFDRGDAPVQSMFSRPMGATVSACGMRDASRVCQWFADLIAQAGNDEDGSRSWSYSAACSEAEREGLRFGAKPFFASVSSTLS